MQQGSLTVRSKIYLNLFFLRFRTIANVTKLPEKVTKLPEKVTKWPYQSYKIATWRLQKCQENKIQKGYESALKVTKVPGEVTKVP